MTPTQYPCDRAWMEIDLGAIGRNFDTAAAGLGGAEHIIAVVKADAYGLGALPIARRLQEHGCTAFAVAFLEEALALRAAGIAGRVLLLGPIATQRVPEAAKNGFEIPAVSLEQARALSTAAEAAGVSLKIQLKLDSGLGRLGIPLAGRIPEAVREALAIAALPALEAVGVFTHLTDGEGPGGRELDLCELARFEAAAAALAEAGLRLPRHATSSVPTVRYPEHRFEQVRVGSLLYGGDPPACLPFVVEPALSIRARIWQVKELPAGAPVGYGPTFCTLRPTKLAVVPIGYADGLRRSLSNRAAMLLHGERAPIIGKICCDHTLLDVTDIPAAAAWDTVTLVGQDGGRFQGQMELARLCPASEAEFTAMLTQRLTRLYRG